MTTTYMLAAGRILPSGAEVNVDWRLAELMEWQREEGRRLPLFADIIIWLENHGYMVDLITGEVSQVEPLQAYIDYQAELNELRDAMDEEEYLRSWH